MRIVIIGSGPAGVTVAETLRNEGFDDEIVLFSGEDFPPYAPAVLVNYFEEGGDTIYWKGVNFCERNSLICRRGEWVEKIDISQKQIVTRKGEELSYDKLVIATGSTLYAPIPCHCTVPLEPGEHRFYNFKSMSAALQIKDKIEKHEVNSAVVVGAGFIGTEIALVLADAGITVTQVEMLDRVMPRMLDAATAAYAERIIRDRGVNLRLNTKGIEFRGRKMVEELQLENGEVLEADMFIAATGVKPNIAFLQHSGLAVNHGILVNEWMGTGAPDVFAAGDVAETVDLITGRRYVHALHPNAVQQGIVVAHNILGYRHKYAGAENMNSLKHLGLPMIAVGEMHGDEELILERGGNLRKIVLKEGRIIGFRLVGDIRSAGVYRSLILKKEDVSAYRRELLSDQFGVGMINSFAIDQAALAAL